MKRGLLFLLPALAACTATDWRKEGATTADLDRDYDDCRTVTKSDPAIAAAFGAFGALGVFAGTSYFDSKIRSCLQGRGWLAPDDAAYSSASAPVPAAAPVRAVETDSAAARRLKELKSLLDQGLITKEEYEDRRQAIVRGL
jgi:hypothetical protein